MDSSVMGRGPFPYITILAIRLRFGYDSAPFGMMRRAFDKNERVTVCITSIAFSSHYAKCYRIVTESQL